MMDNRNEQPKNNTPATAVHVVDEEDAEYGMSVSATELNQLRQHVIAMRRQKATELLEDSSSTSGGRGEARRREGLLRTDAPVNSSSNPSNSKRLFRLAILSNMFFVLGALLYVCVAHGDLQWAKEVKGIPVKVLEADDDLTWREWHAAKTSGFANRLLQQQQQTQTQENTAADGAGDISINDTLWDDLPPDIQLALMILGHNQASWDSKATSSIEELPWEQLDAEEKDAAAIVGYDEQSWNAVEEEENAIGDAAYDDIYYDDQVDAVYSDPSITTAEQAFRPNNNGGAGGHTNVGNFETGDQYLDDQYYDDQYVQGEDPNAQYDDQYVQYDDQYDVTPAEVFDEFAGQHDDYFPGKEETQANPAATTTPAPTQASTTTTDAPNAGAPDTTTTAASDSQSTTSQPSVTANGHTLPTFDNVQSVEDLMVWDGFGWEELPNEIQAHFEILGYNEERWNSGGTAFTEDLYWDELTEPQQEAAMALGYNQYFWDQAEEGNYDAVTGETDESLPNKHDQAMNRDPERGNNGGNSNQPSAKDTSTKDTSSGYGEVSDEYADHGYAGAEISDEYADHKYGETYYTDDEAYMKFGEVDIVPNQVMLFFAAACLTAVGVMNFLRERRVFHIWMVQGGVFGCLASLCMQASDFATLMLQTVSVHCFLIEAIFMLRQRKNSSAFARENSLENLQYMGWAADMLFAMGAVIDVILIYWQHGDEEAYASLNLAQAEVVSAYFWLITAGLHTYCTIFMLNKRMEEDTANAHFDNNSYGASSSRVIEGHHPNGERYTVQPAAIQRRHQQQQDQQQLSDVVIT